MFSLLFLFLCCCWGDVEYTGVREDIRDVWDALRLAGRLSYRIFSDNNTSFLFFQSVCYWCLYWRHVCDRDCVPYNFNSVELNCQAVFYGYDL